MNEVLYYNEWVSLHVVRRPEEGIHGYVYSHETRSSGLLVAVLGFRKSLLGGHEYLLRREVTPCWGWGPPLEPSLSAVTGGWEGSNFYADAVRELREETGYAVGEEELIPLGASYASKSSDTIYNLFAVDLTGREPGELVPDGSVAPGDAVWVSGPKLAEVEDPQVSVMYLRLATRGWKKVVEEIVV